MRIDYRLVLTSQVKEGDICISKGSTGVNLSFLEKERVKDPDKLYCYRTGDVLSLANQKLGQLRKKITQYDLSAYCRAEGIKKKSGNGLYFRGKFSQTPQYSPELLKRFVDAMKKPKRRQRIRQRFQDYMNKRRNQGGVLGFQS